MFKIMKAIGKKRFNGWSEKDFVNLILLDAAKYFCGTFLLVAVLGHGVLTSLAIVLVLDMMNAIFKSLARLFIRNY